MIEHFANGRRVYTVGEAAELRAGPDPAKVRREKDAIRQRLHRAGIKPAGEINPRESVYYPEDLGLETAMRTWTLSTNVSHGTLTAIIGELDLYPLTPGPPIGRHGGASASLSGPKNVPPDRLEHLRRVLLSRDYHASY